MGRELEVWRETAPPPDDLREREEEVRRRRRVEGDHELALPAGDEGKKTGLINVTENHATPERGHVGCVARDTSWYAYVEMVSVLQRETY